MSHLNCLCTMPEITDEAVIEALFAQRPYEEKVLNSAYLEIPAEYQRELSIRTLSGCPQSSPNGSPTLPVKPSGWSSFSMQYTS